MAKTTSKRGYSQRQVGIAHGFRSGLEELIAAQLERLRQVFTYEQLTLKFLKPARISRYTPDFVLSNGIIIESKGRFETADRQKHILVKEQHPKLDIRFVFSNPRSRISKQSKTTYAMWCEKYGFQYAKQRIPQEWIDEPECPVRIAENEKANIKK